MASDAAPARRPPPKAPPRPKGRRPSPGPTPGRARKPKRRAGAPGKARPEHTRNTHGTHTEHTRNAPGRELQPRRSESKRGARRDRSAPPASLRPAKSGRKTPTPIFYGQGVAGGLKPVRIILSWPWPCDIDVLIVLHVIQGQHRLLICISVANALYRTG